MRQVQLLILVPLFLALASCTSGPSAEIRSTHILTGAPEADASFTLDVRGRSVDHIPADWASPAATESRLITGPVNELKAASPSTAEVVLVRPAAGLPDVGSSPLFGVVRELNPARVVIPSGTTAIVAIAPTTTSATPNPASVEILIATHTKLPSLELRAVRRVTDDESALGKSTGELQLLRIPWPLPSRDGEFEVAVPSGPGLDKPTIWSFHARPLTESETREAQSLLDSLKSPAPRASSEAPLAKAIRDAMTADTKRRALAFAAMKLSASLTSEVAVIIPDKSLNDLAESAAACFESAGESPGWRLEAATMQALAKLASAGSLDRAILATLSARYGEVGRDPSNLAYLAKRSASSTDFDSRLEAEHLVLLSDSSPGARVRAFDWLNARNAAPAGYDPLAPSRARSDAVDRHMQAMESRR